MSKNIKWCPEPYKTFDVGDDDGGALGAGTWYVVGRFWADGEPCEGTGSDVIVHEDNMPDFQQRWDPEITVSY